MPSSTIAAVIINLLTVGLPLIGVTLGSEQIQNFVQVSIALATGLWIWYQRTTLQKAPGGVGDVTYTGRRRN